ncbi:hypothetical protein E2562_016613 [Oryza meyeriana var. granulata]|uniref:Uncharacterized protein n=1 Tax=Oryza meyeriana var. granulata TaxID=110450 RepID=A0A6G1EJX1_9ORYZ|nr:hypothetical protein E2562_016613 [Oryza meyeriana var. granulata]
MAYRRKQGMQRSATFVEDYRQPPPPGDTSSPAIASPRATRFADDSRRPDRSLAAQAMLASAAASSPQPDGSALGPVTQLYTSVRGAKDDPKNEHMKNNEAKHGFWGVLAQQAKVMLDENGGTDDGRDHPSLTSQSRWSYDRVRKPENPTLDIGGKIKNVLEEGLTKAEGSSRTGGDVVHARKLHIRRKTCSMDLRNSSLSLASPDMSPMLSDTESPQIKASRDVANAMAAKVKLLQRELKTVKADMAFSKERCAQLEEENRLLRDGNHDADEDLIRQQLETLLAEKARLANENTVYARENRFLREIVEFHQLNMQDVVNLDEDMIGEEEDDDYARAGQQYGCHLRVHEAGGPGTAPQSPLGQAGRMRMSRSNSGAGESPMRRSFLGAPETPPTRRSLKEEDTDVPETPPTRRSLKEEDVDEPETPPTRRSLKEEDVDEPETPPTRRSLKEDDVDAPETPPTRRSMKEDADDAPETPPTRRSFKEDIGSPETATTPTRRSNEDLGAAETTTPTRLSFKDESSMTEMKNED